MNRHEKALELDKILEQLAAETNCADAASAARELSPCGDAAEAREHMADTVAAWQLMARFGSPSFGQVRNMTGALRRADAGATLSMRELLDIAELLHSIRSLAEWRARCEGVATCLDDRFSALSPNRFLEDTIRSAVLSEDEMADGASPELAAIRRKMRAASARVRDQLDRIIRSQAVQKLLQEPIVTIRGGRFVVPVKAEHRGEVPGLVHDTSASGATVFVEPMSVVEANNELRVLQSKEKAEIERVLAELSAQVGTFALAVTEDYRLLVELNVIFAKARLAYKMKATEPRLTEDGHILLRKARHPLIDPHKAVPIDVELGGAFDTLVITGPNTGGKTVTLKTIGLLTLMAMCGLMPPVGDGSSLSVFDAVLSDIGDEQSIEQSLSTFSAHMTNIIRILDEADNHSLVLMDELGAGTDPVEGAALAMAILEQLRQQGARIAATTHYAELKAYAIQTPGVENGSCEFDVASLRPTYRLLVGVPGRSNAFAISERLGMNPALVGRARALVSGEARQLENVVSRLEERRQELETELRGAREEKAKAQREREEAERLLAEIERDKEREWERAKAEAHRLVDRARADAELLMEEINALRKQKNTEDFAAKAQNARGNLRSRLREMENAVDPVAQKKRSVYRLPRPLKAGDGVLIADIDKKGVVLSPPDENGSVQVQAGIIKTRVPLENLRLLEEKAETPAQASAAVRLSHGESGNAGSRSTRRISSELDLRGKMTDEAILLLDQFLDDAAVCGLGQVTVIHGKGTGALRAAVQKHLRGHPQVKSFRLGLYGEGENGVTIVELK